MKKAIIIQGPNTHPNEIINTYSNIDIIFSTLETSDTSLFENTNFIIVKNKVPLFNGSANFNYQVTNTLNGIKKAKELGYEFVFKIRSDITIPDIQRLLNLLGEKKDTIFFSAYHNWDGGYLCEHMVYGEINLMEKLWSIPLSYSKEAPEIQLTKHFVKVLPTIKVDYIFPYLFSDNILAYWEKRNFYLNDYINDKLFTYGEFKKEKYL
jgi:hypothetical protein